MRGYEVSGPVEVQKPDLRPSSEFREGRRRNLRVYAGGRKGKGAGATTDKNANANANANGAHAWTVLVAE